MNTIKTGTTNQRRAGIEELFLRQSLIGFSTTYFISEAVAESQFVCVRFRSPLSHYAALLGRGSNHDA